MKKNNFFKMITIFVFALFLSGCTNSNTIVLFNNQPITTKTIENYRSTFDVGQKIHYVVLCKKGFKDDVLRIQVVKKDEKSEFWGYSTIMNREVEVKNPNYYIDYFVIHNKGHYVMQVFHLKNLQTPITYGDFWVN